MKKQSKFLKVALRAAKKAEKILLKYYYKEIRVGIKKDLSPVTIADKEAEKIIIKTIKKYFPSHGFLAEESASDIKNKDYLWIIDPIDGTKNYLRKIPLFATQIALMEKGELVLGVSNAPLLRELLYAEKGGGAYYNKYKIKVSSVRELKQSHLLFGGIEHFARKNLIKHLISLIGNTRGHRGIGDFWCYHLLAQGKADIMIEAYTKIWDVAAAKIIVEEAGGMVTDIKGKEININTSSFLATNRKLHQRVLASFKK